MPCAGWTVTGASRPAIAYRETRMPSTWAVEPVSEWLRTVDEGKEVNLVAQCLDEDIDGAALVLLGPHRPLGARKRFLYAVEGLCKRRRLR